MKTTISSLLTLIMTISSFVGCGDKTSGNIKDLPETPLEYFGYTENEDGGITITHYSGDFEHVVVPAEIDGKPVTELSDFRILDTPDSVTVSVTLPETLKTIGGSAFESCTSLEKVVLPKSLTEIGAEAFSYCTSLKHVTIPSDCLNTDSWAVFSCSGLETVELKEGVKCIPAEAFYETNLKKVVLPSTVEEIGMQAFCGCYDLEKVILNEGLKTIQHAAFAHNLRLSEIVIPKTVESLSKYSFINCGLKTVKFEGNAPEEFLFGKETIDDAFRDSSKEYTSDFTVYFHKGAEGFTSPTWNGFPAEIW